MKNLYKFILLLLVPLFLFSCGGGEEQTAEKGTPSLSKSDEQLLQTAADKLIMKFHNNLKMELGKALKEGGPANAINVCSEIAPEIADSFSANGWKIKRVSDKNRNPNNHPTPAQMAFLELFAADSTRGLKHASNYDGEIFHYYKPIHTNSLCLTCHGDKDNLAPEVVEKLNERYPDDKATGYDVNQLRGMFVVDIKMPEGKHYAEEIAGSES
ncbi:MAG: DUF3365 domain-containing protein [candidate division Zixibacteria bacterium]|nr:DUF3365 domain-containing protein [candidate division Zixibacteria bacterium]